MHMTMQQPVSTEAHVVDVQRVRDALDLDRRLALVPDAARVRGLFFKVTADEVARHGAAAVAMHRRLSPVKSTWFFRMYPVRDYLEDAAAAATAIAPENPTSALRAFFHNGPRYAHLLNAQRFLALMGATPLDVMRWSEAQRDMFANYGRWRVEPRDDFYFIMHYFDEYIWIDSAHLGGLEGVLDGCGVSGSVLSDIDSPFNGRLHVRWRSR
jgi:uncharacterized protein (TIGR02265 family)